MAWGSEWLQPACGSGHQLTSAESQELTGPLAPARAPPSGRSPGASTIQPGGCQRASTRSWLSGSPATPRALGPAPPSLLPSPASHPAGCASSPQPQRTHSLEGALQGYPWLGAGADCGHRPPPLSSRPWSFAAAGLPASKPEAGQAPKTQEGSWDGKLAASRPGWGRPRWLRVPEHPGQTRSRRARTVARPGRAPRSALGPG